RRSHAPHRTWSVLWRSEEEIEHACLRRNRDGRIQSECVGLRQLHDRFRRNSGAADARAKSGAGASPSTNASADPGPGTPPPTPTPPPSIVTINVVGINGAQSFSPNPATLPAGQMVVWHNVDSITHRVVLND